MGAAVCSSASIPTMEHAHAIALGVLDEVLSEFNIERGPNGSRIKFVGDVPSVQSTKSEHLSLSLIGTIPALANALVATQIYEARGGQPQTIEVDLRKGHNYLDPDIGMTPTINGQEIPLDVVVGNPFIGGIYETADGRHVVPSAVYVDLVYQWSTFLGCAVNSIDTAAAIKRWKSSNLESAAAQAGLPFAIIQSEDTWKATPQGAHMSVQPIVPTKKMTSAPPKRLSPNPKRPLEGLKILCATHAIAGPSAGRTLAEHGASVLQVMYTHGFEHQFVYTYANLGGASTRLNFQKESDRNHMWRLIADADVWIDSYRDGAMAKFGFTDEKMFEVNPNLIISHVRLYGTSGPWSEKPGFDMQGSASSGMMALCGGGLESPAWPPGQVINDYTTGYYGALAIQAAILRRISEGGGYVLSPSLTGTAMSLVKHFKTSRFPSLGLSASAAMPPEEIEAKTSAGILRTLKPLPIMSLTPIKYDPLVLVPMGSSLPLFPGYEGAYDTRRVDVIEKEKVLKSASAHVVKRIKELKEVAARFGLNTAKTSSV